MLKFRKGSIHSISPEFAARVKVMSGGLNAGNAKELQQSLKDVIPNMRRKKGKRGIK